MPPSPRPPLFPYTTLFRSPRPAASVCVLLVGVPGGLLGVVRAVIDLDHHRLLVRDRRAMTARTTPRSPRSEEHTSELQSRPHLVCRLLLEKKKEETNSTCG